LVITRLLEGQTLGEGLHVLLVKHEIVVHRIPTTKKKGMKGELTRKTNMKDTLSGGRVQEIELVEGEDVGGDIEDLREGGVGDHGVVPELDGQHDAGEEEVEHVLVGDAAQHPEVPLHVDEGCRTQSKKEEGAKVSTIAPSQIVAKKKNESEERAKSVPGRRR
jgi:hypothetical protein